MGGRPRARTHPWPPGCAAPAPAAGSGPRAGPARLGRSSLLGGGRGHMTGGPPSRDSLGRLCAAGDLPRLQHSWASPGSQGSCHPVCRHGDSRRGDAGSGRGHKGLVLGQGTFAQPPVLQGPLTRARVPSRRESRRPAGGSPLAAQAAPPGASHPPSPRCRPGLTRGEEGEPWEDGMAAGRRGLRQKASRPEEGACPSDSTGCPRGCRGRPGSPGFGQCRDVAAKSPALGQTRPQAPTGSSQAAPFDEG